MAPKREADMNPNLYCANAFYSVVSAPFVIPTFIRRLEDGETYFQRHQELASQQRGRGCFDPEGEISGAGAIGTFAGAVTGLAGATAVLMTNAPADDYIALGALLGLNALSFVCEIGREVLNTGEERRLEREAKKPVFTQITE